MIPIIVGSGILVMVIIISLIMYDNDNINNFTSTFSIDCVVARYNESVSWLFMDEFKNVTRFFIYNKGRPIVEPMPDNAIEILLPNVGKCDHTFLHHIIYNYSDLADVTLFVSGRADDSRKGGKILRVMKLVNKTHNSVFDGYFVNVPKKFKNFSMDYYLSGNPENQIDEGSITKLTPAKIRPFGKWYESYWGNQKTNIFIYQSIFAVHKNHILQHPKDYYKPFYEELNYSVNPEAGHYMERAWGILFYPYPKKCKYFM